MRVCWPDQSLKPTYLRKARLVTVDEWTQPMSTGDSTFDLVVLLEVQYPEDTDDLIEKVRMAISDQAETE